MLEPEGLYELAGGRPDVTGAVLIEAMDGFVDAGGAVRGVREHLLGGGEHEVIARFDVDQLHDYRARRPLMGFDRDHWTSFEAPELALHHLRDAAGQPFLLLAGPEPDTQWERFAAAVGQLVERLGVRLTVGLGAFPMSLPHTRPTRVILHGSRPELLAGYTPWLGEIVVPASAGHLLEHRLGQAGHDTLGLAAPVPPYLTQARYPEAAAALLRELGRRAELDLPLAALEEEAATTRAAIDREVAESAEVTELVRALERQYDAHTADGPEGAPGGPAGPALREGDLPSADELGAELERFLSEHTGGEPG